MSERTAYNQRHKALCQLRELAMGVRAIDESVRDLGRVAGAAAREQAQLLTDLRWSIDAVGVVLMASLEAQRLILEVLRTPRMTAADELTRDARSLAERGLWPEALAEYDGSIATRRDQPDAHYGRGIALLAVAEEAPEPIPVATVRAAAESFAKAVRFGRTTMPAVAGRAALAAAVLYDRAGEPESGDRVLREAAEGITSSPDVLFAAGRRLRAPEFLVKAAELDPTLVADPLWPDDRYAASVTSAVLARQRAAAAAAHAALATGATVAPLPAAMVEQPPTAVTGVRTMRELVETLEQAERQLSVPTPHETGLEERQYVAAAQVTTADVAFRRVSMPAAVVVLGILAIPFICGVGVLSEYVAASRGVNENSGFGIGAGFAVAVVAVVFAVLLPISMARYRRQRRRRGEGLLAARGAAQSLQVELQQRRQQRDHALGAVRAARENVERLQRRAANSLQL